MKNLWLFMPKQLLIHLRVRQTTSNSFVLRQSPDSQRGPCTGDLSTGASHRWVQGKQTSAASFCLRPPWCYISVGREAELGQLEATLAAGWSLHCLANDSRAMMVHLHDADATNAAVVRSLRAKRLALVAVCSVGKPQSHIRHLGHLQGLGVLRSRVPTTQCNTGSVDSNTTQDHLLLGVKNSKATPLTCQPSPLPAPRVLAS